MSNIMLSLLFYILVNRVNSGYSTIILTKNKDVSGTSVDSFVVGHEVKIRHEFERPVRDVEIVHTKPNEDAYKYETDYNPPEFEFPDWDESWKQQTEHQEERERQDREEQKREKRELEEELQKRVVINIIIAGVAVTLTVIGVTIYLRMGVQCDARQRSQPNIQADDNHRAGTTRLDNRTRQFAAIEDRTLISLRGNVEASSNDHRNDQEELPCPPISFLPNLYGNSNSCRTHNLPTVNLRDHSNSSSNHDLPPSYEEAVVGLEPTAPPGINGQMPNNKI